VVFLVFTIIGDELTSLSKIAEEINIELLNHLNLEPSM